VTYTSTSLSDMVTYLSAVLHVMATLCALIGVRKTQCAAGGELCDMLSTLGTCNGRSGTAARECMLRYPGRRHPDANVFRRFEQRLRETGRDTRDCRSPT
jgi:hypothetical protein